MTARLDAVWNILSAATAATLSTFRTIPDVAKALEGLTDEQAMALIERRRSAGAGASDLSVRQAEFEVLNVLAGSRGRDDPNSPFLAQALPRVSWDRAGSAQYGACRPRSPPSGGDGARRVHPVRAGWNGREGGA